MSPSSTFPSTDCHTLLLGCTNSPVLTVFRVEPHVPPYCIVMISVTTALNGFLYCFTSFRRYIYIYTTRVWAQRNDLPQIFWPLSKADSSWYGLPSAFWDVPKQNQPSLHFPRHPSCHCPRKGTPIPFLPLKTSQVQPLFQLLGCPGVKGQVRPFDHQAAHGHTCHPAICFSTCGHDDFGTHLAVFLGKMSDSLERENSTCLDIFILILLQLIEPKQKLPPKMCKDKRGLRKRATTAETTNHFPKGQRMISYVGKNLQPLLLSFLFSFFFSSFLLLVQ